MAGQPEIHDVRASQKEMWLERESELPPMQLSV